MLCPTAVAEQIIDGIRDERFLITPHPEVATFFQRKATDYDRWLAGMRRLQDQVSGAEGQRAGSGGGGAPSGVA